MPRVYYHERLYGNLYDAVGVLGLESNWRLFNNRNIGVPHLTNMLVGGRMDHDGTFVIANVYTRTNMGKSRPDLSDGKRDEIKRRAASRPGSASRAVRTSPARRCHRATVHASSGAP